MRVEKSAQSGGLSTRAHSLAVLTWECQMSFSGGHHLVLGWNKEIVCSFVTHTECLTNRSYTQNTQQNTLNTNQPHSSNEN